MFITSHSQDVFQIDRKFAKEKKNFNRTNELSHRNLSSTLKTPN